MRELLPSEVAVVEAYDDSVAAPLLPEEAAAVAQAVSTRRAEYAAVRHLARLALAELGEPAAPIPTGRWREPVWPSGIVGSMTHCRGYRGVAVARAGDVASVGIDAEPHEPLPERLIEVVARPEERTELLALAAHDASVHWGRLLFCAKEAAYKAWWPLTGRALEFEEALAQLDPEQGTFLVRFLVPTGPADRPAPLEYRGRWTIRDGIIRTAVLVTAPEVSAGREKWT